MVPKVDATSISNKKVEVKCFVDLIGGGQAIYYSKLAAKKVSRLPYMLEKNQNSVFYAGKKRQIYRVNECVSKFAKFSSKIANRIEKTTPR